MKPVVTSENAAGLKPIDIGDALPTLVLRNEKDEEFDVSTVAKTKGAIIFLVPKVNTGKLVFYLLDSSTSPYPPPNPVSARLPTPVPTTFSIFSLQIFLNWKAGLLTYT